MSNAVARTAGRATPTGPVHDLDPGLDSQGDRFTQGEWRVEYDGWLVMGGKIIINRDSCAPEIADQVERVANGHLISAAPDLLAGCRELIVLARRLDHLLLQASGCESDCERGEIERALRAVAKAAGMGAPR